MAEVKVSELFTDEVREVRTPVSYHVAAQVTLPQLRVKGV